MTDIRKLQDIANILRRDSLIMTSTAKSGHATSCLSCAEIMSSLFFHEMHYDTKAPKNPDNDEFILSKGHASAIYYASLFRAGCIKTPINTYRKLTSPLEGHPLPSNALPWIKVATGSLGQGLSVGLGMALAAKLQKRNYRTYVLLGDSELSEGSIYEAIQLAVFYKLNNLCAIVDVNRLGQRGETMVGYNIDRYKKRFEAFGWSAQSIDGHNIPQLLRALEHARHNKKPSLILAKTFKGKGVSFLQNQEGWHGKALSEQELKQALQEIPSAKMPQVHVKKPEKISFSFKKLKTPSLISFQNKEIATREAYGKALANLTKANSSIIAIDAEVSNSTFAEEVKKSSPRQFIEAYIAEQNMVGMALGLSIKGFKVFASTFSAFLTRAHDQLRMSALSRADITFCGSHSGVSIGQDGASQMGLEDIAMFRDLPNSTIFYPSDAVSAEKLVYKAAKNRGITYIRTTRPKTPLIYKKTDAFPIGDFKIIKSSSKDKAVLAGAGITLHESLKAYDELKKRNILTAVIDLYCIKPFNNKKLISFMKKHGSKLVIAEDHYPEGGIGEMLAEAIKNTSIKIAHLAVSEIPHSGKPEELLAKYEIDAKAIEKAATIKFK